MARKPKAPKAPKAAQTPSKAGKAKPKAGKGDSKALVVPPSSGEPLLGFVQTEACTRPFRCITSSVSSCLLPDSFSASLEKNKQTNKQTNRPEHHNLKVRLLDAAAGNQLAEIQQLLQQGVKADETVVGVHFGRTALMLAASGGHEDIVATLLAAGADVNAADQAGRARETLLHACIACARCS